MKVRLDAEERNLTLFSPDELIHFRDEFQARSFLTMFLSDPSNIHTLRDLLGQEYGWWAVSGLSDEEVLGHVSRLIARTCVGLVRVELRDMVPAGAADGAAESEELEPDETPLSEEEYEPEELKPEPQIPPLFPIIAKLEADKVDWERRQYNIRLDLMRYVGLEDPGESEIAPEFPDTAAATGQGLKEGAESFSQQLLGIADPASGLDKSSEVADKLAKTAEEAGDDLVGITEGTSQGLQRLLAINPPPPAPSSMAPFMQDFSESQGDAVKGAAEDTASTLGRLLENDAEPAPPSQMADLFKQFAEEQGQGVADVASQAADDLAKSVDVSESGPLPTMDGAMVLEAMNASAEETGLGVIAATKTIAAGMGKFAPAPPAEATGDDSDAHSEAAEAAADAILAEHADEAAEGEAEATDAEADALVELTKSALSAIAPPAWAQTADGRPAEVLDAIHGSLLEQTGGVLKATWAAATALDKLAPPIPTPIQAATAAANTAATAVTAAAAALQSAPPAELKTNLDATTAAMTQAREAADEASGLAASTRKADEAQAALSAAEAARAAANAAGDIVAEVKQSADPEALARAEVALEVGTLAIDTDGAIDLDASTVTDANGAPSMLGSEIKRSVRQQGDSVIDIATTLGADFERFAPKPKAPVAPALDAEAASPSEAAAAPRTPVEHFQTTWVVPEPPPTPDWEAPEVEIPAGFDGLGPEAWFEKRAAERAAAEAATNTD